MSAEFKVRQLVPIVSFMGFGVVAVLSADPALAQCAMCGQAAAGSTVETREALNYAILGMAMAPYAVAGVAAWVISPALRESLLAALRRRTDPREGRDQP